MSECIATTYSRNPAGYGKLKVKGKDVMHHRLTYCQHHGIELESIVGKVVMHTCDNRACVNPAHLVLGTNKDNTADMDAKGRRVSKARRLTDEQIEEIRRAGVANQRDTAKLYGVDHTIIGRVINRKGAYK